MSFSDSYDNCMARKGLPLLGEIFSRKTFVEALEILDEIHSAIEAAGGEEVTLTALAAASSSLGLSADAMEVLALLGAGTVNIAAHLYLLEATQCVAVAVVRERLHADLAEVPDGFIKDGILSNLEASSASA